MGNRLTHLTDSEDYRFESCPDYITLHNRSHHTPPRFLVGETVGFLGNED